jgi:hypothetical protein
MCSDIFKIYLIVEGMNQHSLADLSVLAAFEEL